MYPLSKWNFILIDIIINETIKQQAAIISNSKENNIFII